MQKLAAQLQGCKLGWKNVQIYLCKINLKYRSQKLSYKVVNCASKIYKFIYVNLTSDTEVRDSVIVM